MKEVYCDCCYTTFSEIELKDEKGNLDMIVLIVRR